VNEKKPSEDPWYKYVLTELEGGITHPEFFQKVKSSTNAMNYIEEVDGNYSRAAEWFEENGYPKQAQRCKTIDEKYAKGGNVMKRCTEIGKGHTSAFVGHFATQLTHPDIDRYISIREALSIMKMPKDFQLQGGRKNLNMICQNVPVCTAQDMATNVLKYLDGGCDTQHATFVRQNNTNRTIEYINNEPSLVDFFVDTTSN
jgi:site-specific DNA-cytosine methylase